VRWSSRYDGLTNARSFVKHAMPTDTITIALNGEVKLNDFSGAMEHFAGLVLGLTTEVGGGAEIIWVVEQLESGSAVATIRGEADDPTKVERVVRAYADVGEALAQRRPIPFPAKVAEEARAIVRILNSSITSIRFETPERDVTIVSPDLPPLPQRRLVAYGSTEGRVQTLTSRGRLRFTLYDTLNDRPVTCYIAEEQAELMRDVWGRRVIVEGLVSRDPASGQPATIREISRIEVVPDQEPGSFRRAIGALEGRHVRLSPEDAIRRLRDAQ
jgi:hypothetical protein